MSEKTIVKPKPATKPQTQRPKLWKVILLNDDYTPREFVVQVLKAVFRMNAERAYRVMITAHRRGACVIAVYTKDVADTKAKEATELGKRNGYPLYFTTEPEE
ncbi:MAG: ATP-dependent Clp protease adapter ClpS [Hyphomicrobiales bacterium]|nr:ATP-dependent Clp protease adapter ClpS [Hyphomicrobiales bacterium]